MALLATDDGRPVPCAAVFTQNKFVAPPVELDRATLAANGGQAAAVIVNSGNANAGTGKAGYKDAQLMAAATGKALQVANSHVMVCSTGIIGTPLPMDPILDATPEACEEAVGRRRRRCGARDPDDRSQAQAGRDPAARTSRSAGWPRAAA